MTSETVRFDGTKPNFPVWNEFFHTNGYIIIDNALDKETTSKLKEDLDKLNKAVAKHKLTHLQPSRHIVHKCVFENSSTVVGLVSNSVISNFAQYVIRDGPSPPIWKSGDSLQMHLIHNNAFSVPAGGRGQAPGWHTDDPPLFDIPYGKTLPDWVKLKCLVATYMIWLSDCESISNGPTAILPKSHRFGQKVDWKYAEKNCIHATGKAGTAVLVHSQVWHRGSENTSTIPRDTIQFTFARRIIGHKHKTIMNYVMPPSVYEGMDDETRARLGFLQGGAYS
jgi:ectoine hydroxylase-related dioxygenase (phytanoyl-CoA dioxygenase family)